MLYGLLTFQLYVIGTLRWFAGFLCVVAVFALGYGLWARVGFSSRLLLLALAFPLLVFVGFLYACSPAHAYREIQKYLAGFAAFIIVYVLLKLRRENLRPLLWLLVGFFALHTLLSVETASSRLLLSPLIAALRESSTYLADIYGYWSGARMQTLLNANVTAPMNLMGVFLCYHLYGSAQTAREKSCALACACLLAMGFVLCVSLGSIMVGVVVILLSVALYDKRGGADALAWYAAAFVCGLACAVLAYPFMGRGGGAGLVASVAALLCAGLGFALRRPMEKLAGWQTRQKWLLLGGVLGVAVLCAGLALVIPAPVKVSGSAKFERIVAAAPGEQQLVLSLAGEGAQPVVQAECLRFSGGNLETTLADFELAPAQTTGEEYTAAFTAPAGTEAVRLTFALEGEYTLTAAALDAESSTTAVPLRRALLPEFIYQRVQGLQFNQSAAARFANYCNALTIFGQSPVFGQGAGAFEVRSQQVQTYANESKYVHSHYLQTLVETGVVGLGLWLAGVALAVFLLFKARRGEAGQVPLANALLSALAMSLIHSVIDYEMSFELFLVVFYALLAVVAVMFEQPIALPKPVRGAQVAVMAAAPVLMLLLCIGTGVADAGLQALNAKQRDTGILSAQELSAMARRGVALDPANAASYKVNFLTAVYEHALPPPYDAEAEAYARQLDKAAPVSGTVCVTLMNYYSDVGDAEDVDAMLKYARMLPTTRILAPALWNKAFMFCDDLRYTYPDREADIRATLAELAEAFDAVQATAVQPMELGEQAAEVLDFVRGFNM